MSDADRQPLPFPPGIEVEWVVNPEPTAANTQLTDAVKAKPWLSGSPAVWIAGEGQTVKALRRYVKRERGVDPDRLYASPYWQIGMTEDVHQVAKRKEEAV